MKTYKAYEENGETIGDNLINFKMYRDLRGGNYVFTPNKTFDIYKFYDINENKFLSYDSGTNMFILSDFPSDFILTSENRIFDISNRVFMKKTNQKIRLIIIREMLKLKMEIYLGLMICHLQF